MSEYLVPAGYGEIEYVEKRSRFIGRVWRTDTEAEALRHIREMREKHWDASHNVYAYAVREGGAMRYSDDGEPSGTSGMPVLNVFRAGGIQDFCCVVTRYFGGILLGAGGLTRAYAKAASMALEAAGRAEMRRLLRVSLTCTYTQYERIRAELPRFGAEADDAEYGADVALTLLVRPERWDALGARLTELTSGAAPVSVVGETMRAVPLLGETE